MAPWWRIHLPMQETQIWSLGREDPLEVEMAAHSSILAWEIPRVEEPGGLQSRDTSERLCVQRIEAPSHWDYTQLCADKETLPDHPVTVTYSLRPSSLEDTVMLSFKRCYANETTQHKALSGFLPSAKCPWHPSKFMWISILLPFCCWVVFQWRYTSVYPFTQQRMTWLFPVWGFYA